jgi:hypothetical protein
VDQRPISANGYGPFLSGKYQVSFRWATDKISKIFQIREKMHRYLFHTVFFCRTVSDCLTPHKISQTVKFFKARSGNNKHLTLFYSQTTFEMATERFIQQAEDALNEKQYEQAISLADEAIKLNYKKYKPYLQK